MVCLPLTPLIALYIYIRLGPSTYSIIYNRLPRLPSPDDLPPCFLTSALPSYTSYDSLPISYYLFPLPIADCKRSLLNTISCIYTT